MRPDDQRVLEMVRGVHGRVCEMFPLFVVNGWRYRGFKPEDAGEAGIVVVLRFEKPIGGREAYVNVQLGEPQFNDSPLKLRDVIVSQLQSHETMLHMQRAAQLECAGAA